MNYTNYACAGNKRRSLYRHLSGNATADKIYHARMALNKPARTNWDLGVNMYHRQVYDNDTHRCRSKVVHDEEKYSALFVEREDWRKKIH